MRTICLLSALLLICPISSAKSVGVYPTTLTAEPAIVNGGDSLTLTLVGAPRSSFVMMIMGPNTGSLDMLYFSLGVVPPFIYSTFAGAQPDGTRVQTMAVPAIPPGVTGLSYYMQTVAPSFGFSTQGGFSFDFYVSNVASFTFGE